MKEKLILIGVLITLMVCAGLSLAAEKGKAAKQKVVPGTILYVCNCGADCQCDTASTKPGNCKCGKKLLPMHVLKIEGDEAILCTCGKKCACKFNAADPSKCGCGQPVKKVSLKGLYACRCGEGCVCNTISDKPGKCKCGNELKKVG
ncbi:MAG: hypothetical protein CVU71_16090 [Deltaproteobacteria bacterium HGW-Deltaproteobacteria-6]|jgi:hypothetical protein|nr:MAG: hypothetical protein CVU71_16090 [Deltaproteobacteria bacterium HGW-Deltaproteobacteria-6]